ncbi:transglutaminase-like cysteine peptidase [Candidatus Ferrigenium straubiae]|jgi:predicted transglutaminase-like cysteine proteinase|uniref:transglutaminase-like cysteine peptidase n=1 Tax=Candidatus Ferrigenium straubiae TaxID=2919506 RepID=UPI003F4AE489
MLMLFAASMMLFSLARAAGFDADRLLKSITQRFGAPATQKFRDWQKLVADTEKIADPDQQIQKVNEFWNRRMQFMEDKDAWEQSDYWATPMESLGHGKGDCEDYAIAKYFTLLSAGMDVSQLRLIYVKARMGGTASNITQAHMVLAYYSDPDAEPQILDNLLSDIRPASRRQDLSPVFSFNGQGIWAGVSASGSASSTSTKRLSRWEELLARARAEGFE